jgi:hypothetical protein
MSHRIVDLQGFVSLRQVLLSSQVILLAALMSVGCADSERSAQGQAVAGTEQSSSTPVTRRCYRNEYPFDDIPGEKDVQTLTVEIDGDRAVGEYNWLPAFKDKRVGRFEGVFDGHSVVAMYRYAQEGQSASTEISIRLEPEYAVVEGGKQELGLRPP